MSPLATPRVAAVEFLNTFETSNLFPFGCKLKSMAFKSSFVSCSSVSVVFEPPGGGDARFILDIRVDKLDDATHFFVLIFARLACCEIPRVSTVDGRLATHVMSSGTNID